MGPEQKLKVEKYLTQYESGRIAIIAGISIFLGLAWFIGFLQGPAPHQWHPSNNLWAAFLMFFGGCEIFRERRTRRRLREYIRDALKEAKQTTTCPGNK